VILKRAVAINFMIILIALAALHMIPLWATVTIISACIVGLLAAGLVQASSRMTEFDDAQNARFPEWESDR
jgi:type III secretory pathway component EscS